MKTYQSNEIVKAVKCDSVIRNEIPECKSLFTLQANDGVHYEVPSNIFSDGEPQLAFYIVEHDGGYRSWSPAAAFEKWCREIGAVVLPSESCDECLRHECLLMTRADCGAHYRITEAEAYFNFIKSGKIPETPTGAATLGGAAIGGSFGALSGGTQLCRATDSEARTAAQYDYLAKKAAEASQKAQ